MKKIPSSVWRHISTLLVLCLVLSAPFSKAADSSDSQAEKSAPTGVIDSARAAIAKQDFAAAIKQLKQALATQPQSADALNLMGYSLRKSGQLDQALDYYTKALKIEPEHLGANEYLGELYLQRDQLKEAEQRLSVLDGACFLPCEEFKDLKKAISAYRQRKGLN